ncbi:MAG: hypothetical protein ACRDFS_01260, partial [Chloroflexota bacterium]
MSRRDRKKAGQLPPGWSPLYENVLATDAVRTLPPAFYRVYVVACAFCKPYINGAVPLARSQMRRLGVTSSRTMTRAIAELIARKLIVCTKPARPRHAALYGVTHLPLSIPAMEKAGISASTRSHMESEISDPHG